MAGTGHLARLLTRLQRGAATAGRDASGEWSAKRAPRPAPISRAACSRVRAHCLQQRDQEWLDSDPERRCCNAGAQPLAHPGAWSLAGSSSGGFSLTFLPAYGARGVAG
jgi:hypothetical protein